jgi:hypothetical protein
MDVYCISNEGSTQHYAHFLLGCLIPLILYIEKYNPAKVILKINIKNMLNIVNDVFNNIETNYVAIPKNYCNDMFSYYDYYIRLYKHPNKNEKLLKAFDLFNDYFYLKYKDCVFDLEKYKLLKKQYIMDKLDKTKKNEFKILKYKRYSDKLKINKKKIINFFLNHPKYKNKYNKRIVLIERLRPIFVGNNIMDCFGGQRRIIHNHNELKRVLEKKYGNDFLNIALDNLSIFEQFDLFYNAEIIIGQHGAGLTNIYFCKNNIKIIEITPKYNDNNNWFKNLSHFLEYNYVNIEQPGLTKKEWGTYNIESANETLLKSFIENSGSICIDEIIKNIEK